MNTLNYCNNTQNDNYHLALHDKSALVQFVYNFQLKKRKSQDLGSGTFCDKYEHISRFLQSNKNNHDDGKVHQQS